MSRHSRKQAIRRRNIFLASCAVVLALVIFGGISIFNKFSSQDKKQPSNSAVSTSSAVNKEENKEPYIVSSATVINTGDVMVHSTQLEGAVTSSGDYDFTDFFKNIGGIVSKADLGIGNLEVTFGGKESGSFKGYPAFNTPDVLADCLKDAGFDLMLTINNHSYDTGFTGLKRTLAVLKSKNIDFVGTRENSGDKNYKVKDVNGIKIGMTAFSYQKSLTAGQIALNGNPISSEAAQLVNVFSYEDKQSFLNKAKTVIDNMKNDGAEKIVFYMHWGEEYQLKENSHQDELAQGLCDLGVDIIVGSHPHVIQPVELLTSADNSHKTVCAYSMGNAISNQRQEIMNPECTTGHTEDGMLLTYKFDKYSDGTVKLSSFDILPTWVNKYRAGSGYHYSVIPLENENAGESFGLSGTELSKSKNSYNRTKETVSSGLNKVQEEIGCKLSFK